LAFDESRDEREFRTDRTEDRSAPELRRRRRRADCRERISLCGCLETEVWAVVVFLLSLALSDGSPRAPSLRF